MSLFITTTAQLPWVGFHVSSCVPVPLALATQNDCCARHPGRGAARGRPGLRACNDVMRGRGLALVPGMNVTVRIHRS